MSAKSTSTGTTTTKTSSHFEEEEECHHHQNRYYWSFDEKRLANARRRRWNDFGETMKEEENNFKNYETQFVAFTMSGKPVWSRFGDVVKLSSLVGALSAICAVAEEEEEEGEEEGELDDDGEETVSREGEDEAKKKKKKKKKENRREGQLHYVEKRCSPSSLLFSGTETTAKPVVVRLAVLRKGALRFAAVSKDPLDTEHVLKVKLETISKAFTFLFGDAIEMNLRRSNHRFDPRKAFFRTQEDVYLKSVAESCEGGDAFACTSGRFFRTLAMREERREKVTEVLANALERCGDHSKTCFAVIYTERKGVVAYASPKTTIRSRGVFEGFNANVVGSPSSFESKGLRAEDVWYLMHHVRTVDRYTMNKKLQDNKGRSNSTSPRKQDKHSRKASFGEEIVLAGGGIVVKPPPPPPMPSSSFAPAHVTLLEKFKRTFCEDAYDMSICLLSGAEGAKFVLARTMKIRLNEDELVGKEVEYDDSRVKENLDDETMYISIVSKSEDAAARAHESMDELFARMHSQNLLRDIFLATHERENDIVNSIAPALVNAIAYTPSLSDDDEEERESDIVLTETAKSAIAKLEHFVYAKPELGQYQIADEEEEKKKSDGGEKRKRILQKYARMHAAAHYEDANRKFHDDMLEDIEKSKASDEMLESVGSDGGVGSSSSLSPQSSSEFRGGGFFNFGGLTLNDGGGTGTTESNDNSRLSPMASRILSGLGRSASGTSDTSDDINTSTKKCASSSDTSANEKRKTSSSSEQEEGEDEQNQDDGDSTTHRVRYESDRSGVRIGCFGRDFELFCQFKPNTSCEDAVATTNRLSSHLKARESDMWL